MLHDQRSRSDLIATADVKEVEGHPAASAKLAVNSQMEERQLPHPVFHLQSHAERSDVSGLERCFLTNNRAFGPGLAMYSDTGGFHDGVPLS